MSLVIQLGIIALLLFTPLAFGAVETWAVSILEIAAFGLLAARLVSYGFGRSAARQSIPWIPPAVFILFAAGGLWPWLGSESLFPHGTREAFVLGAAYLAIFWLVISTVKTEKEVNRIVLALLVIGFGAALFAIFQKYTWNGKMYWAREIQDNSAVFGPFVNRNHFAGYMEMLIPLSVGYTVAAFAGVPARGETAWRRFIDRLTSEQGNQLALLLFMTLVMSVSLVLSFSRTGILSFLTAVTLIGMILWMSRATKRWVLLPGTLLAVLILSLTWFGLGPIIARVQTLLRITEDPSMLGRVQVWKDTVRIVSDYPLTGTGLGTFGVAYPAYKTLPDPVFYEHAHNDYVQLLAETGWVGFALALGILGVILGLIIAGWRRRRNPWAKGLLMGLFTGILALLIHGITDFNFHIPANAMLFTVLLGLAWNLSSSGGLEKTADPTRGRLRLAGTVVGLAVIGGLLYQSTAAFAADRYYRCGLALEKQGRYELAAEDFRRAISWDPADPLHRLALAKIDERLYRQGDRASLEAARFELERAVAAAPTLAEPHLHLGWVHAQLGETTEATAEFNQVLKLDPTNNNWRHFVGLWFAGTGQTDRALLLARQLRENRQEGMAKEIEEKLKKT